MLKSPERVGENLFNQPNFIKMKKGFFVFGLFIVIAFAVSSCGEDEVNTEETCFDGIKNQNETGTDCGGVCTACAPSCNDGIQNQGETGVDCGGPCAACPTSLCNGIASNLYLPLAMDNSWFLESTTSSEHIKFLINGVPNPSIGKIYYNMSSFTVIGSSALNEIEYAVRVDSLTGDIYENYDEGGANYNEYLFIPANPTTGQVIAAYPSGRQRIVANASATVTTSDCTYTGCLMIQDKFSNGSVSSTYYFKKGIGFLKYNSSWELSELTLN